ncbi:MAG: hypothetical protein COB12_03375 [Flavobacterium sp.]|nr:MAG: hypothetical protein COB12_03375 [Flavobacterium sp.]
MNKDKTILLLKKGDKNTLLALYKEHKKSFYNYAQRFSICDEILQDIYHDATIALHENAIDGKLNKINCSIKTYLFSIGKNMIFEQLRKEKKTLTLDTSTYKENYSYDVAYDNTPENEEQNKVLQGLNKLGESCKNLLQLFYYRGFTNIEIKETLGYNSIDVVKSMKWKCLKQLKIVVKNHE